MPHDTAPAHSDAPCAQPFTRRILLAVTGLSPQIVTETLFALATRQDGPFVPSEIHLITTREGAQRARLALLSEHPGWFHRLRKDYHLPPIHFTSDCLALDWPHAIGSDAKGVLVWRSGETFGDWHAAMKFLARTKINFRHDLGFVGGQPHREPQGRHLLAYPVTNHSVRDWGNNARLANTLRFKLHREGDALRALIYHTPCKPTLPHDNLGLRGLLDTWQQVHRFLDDQPTLARLD